MPVEVAVLQLDEYLGLPPGDPRSYRSYLEREGYSVLEADTGEPTTARIETILSEKSSAAAQ